MAKFLDDDNFIKFRDLIYEKSGIFFSDANRSVLESRLREKLHSLKCLSVEEYYERLKGDEEEVRAFLDLVTTNLTRFFRNEMHFDTLAKFILPKLIDLKTKRSASIRKIKVWSAGCSTGEEPYSLAILLQESLPADFTFEIYASDLSLSSLMVAKKGLYSAKRVRQEVPKVLVNRYFVPVSEQELEVSKQLKKLVHFDYHNLKHKSYFKDLDIVFCRNVLIYFDETSQKNALINIWNTMTDHSYLFIGHSESLFALDVPFRYYKTPYSIIYMKDRNN